MHKSIIATSLIMAALLVLTVGCEEDNPVVHGHEFEVSFTYTPNPAPVDSTITFTFKVESDGVHVEGLTDVEAEFEMGTMTPVEISLTEDATEHGQFEGSATFPMGGDYEVHFHYIHEGESDHIELTTGFTVL